MHSSDTTPEIKSVFKKKIDQNRRAFIKTAALVGGAIFLTGAPLTTYVISPALKKGSGKWVDFGPATDLPDNGFEMLSYEFMVKDGWLVLPQRGFVWARSEKGPQVKVFSSTCSHLACNVIWQQETGTFNCPCHSGRFNADGRPVSGPPTRPLKELKHKIEDDNLLVYLTI
ncbi:MAG: ubiquinol-cytochrome c reductase iron-sulfur subunit [Deltaproteobacteria bacterium]|nr:ubiquinol-cytochrome c reductase iron-sulfur subunit [Deltaproteobacteria bacterium]